jgi:hypothetical protein
VIKGVEKIEAYVYEEGLARFCTVSRYSLNFTEQLQKTGWNEHEKPVHASHQLQPK